MSGLPEGWRETTLSGVAMVNIGQSPPGEATNSDGRGLPLVGGASEFHDGRILASRYTATPTKVAEPNDIIFCIRATIGKVAVAHRPVCLGRGVAGFRATNADTNWLRYLLVHLGPEIDAAGTGTTFRQVGKQTLSDWPVLLPPLSEQHGIAAKLDSLTGRTARAREQLERIPRLVERYKGALLAAAFKDGFGIENDTSCFVPRPLSTAVRSTFYGPRIAKEAYVSSGTPTLRTTDIGEWGRLCPQDPPQVSVGQQENSKWAFHDGDLMVTRTGATIGKCAVYEDRFGPALPSAYLIRVRLDMQIAVPQFVLLFLLSPKGQQQLLDGRTAVAQPNINANAILSVELPLPPIELQKSIVHRIEAAFAWLDRVAAEHANASRLLPKLDRAILAKAFRGELVLSDRQPRTLADVRNARQLGFLELHTDMPT